MSDLEIPVARLEEKLDALTDKMDAHHDWEASRHVDQEKRIRSLETHRWTLWGSWLAIIAAVKFGFVGGPH